MNEDFIMVDTGRKCYNRKRTLQNCDIENALFILLVLDMEHLILDRMSLANRSEKDLCEKGEIITDFKQ